MANLEQQGAKIVITGAAGLVGQNLIAQLKRTRCQIVALDKHPANTAILRELHPEICVLQVDLAEAGNWQDEFKDCTHLVIAHAQIGGIYTDDYIRNNVTATARVLEAARAHSVPYAVSISSSVVNSLAVDDYTETKKQQEALEVASGIKQVVLRPTLMFGWFDRKHIGWLARFMRKSPVFPIPGNGRYLRQPLYVGDFCAIIISALEQQITGTYNISGQERVDYIDLICALKKVTGSRTIILKVPYALFKILLRINQIFDKNPAFTTKQLQALVTPDIFEVIDWPAIFNVSSTPLEKALAITFQDPIYSKVVLEF